MVLSKVNINEKLALVNGYWNPGIAAELNGQHVKLVKFKGEFVWHSHEHEDEMFLVLKGSFTMQFRTHSVTVNENEFIVVPRGIEHCPLAEEEVSVMLFEPASTLNTGDADSELRKTDLERI